MRTNTKEEPSERIADGYFVVILSTMTHQNTDDYWFFLNETLTIIWVILIAAIAMRGIQN